MNATTTVEQFRAEAEARGFTVEVEGGGSYGWTVTVRKSFAPGDRDAYVSAENDAYYLLGFAPQKYPGSVWGTDGATVGGHVGLTNGYMVLHKSGVGARWARAAGKK